MLKNISSIALLLVLFYTCSHKNNPNPVTDKSETSPPNLNTITNEYFDVLRPLVPGDLAFETTAYVEKFWRLAGNEGFNKSIYKIEEELRKAGYVIENQAKSNQRLVYRIESRPIEGKTWEPVSASLSVADTNESILQFATNRNMLFVNSASTPSAGVEATVLYINDKNDLNNLNLKGKILFAEMSPHLLYNSQVFEKGAIGIMTYDNPDYLQPVKNNTSIQFRNLPEKYADRAWGIALSYKAKEQLNALLQNGELKLKVNINTKQYNSEELTIIAQVKGSTLPNESLVLSAHVQEPGANDNASGVGAQLEMAVVTANLVQSKKLDLSRTLTFLWGDEIISTRRYINEPFENKPAINWGISLDMVGENTELTGGSFLIEKMPDPSAIYTRGNDKHTEWGGNVLTEDDMRPHYLNDFIFSIFEQQGKFANWEVNTNPFEGGSDHTPFLDADIPGLLLWHFTDQFYHTDNDRLDKVSKQTLQNVITASLVSAFTLLNGNNDLAFSLVTEIKAKAIARLNTEFKLSQNIIATKQSSQDKEMEILKSWNNWYQKAIASVLDLVPKNDSSIKISINAAQREVQLHTESLINSLSE